MTITWGEFKRKVEEQGVTDDVELGVLDCSPECPNVEFSDYGGKPLVDIW